MTGRRLPAIRARARSTAAGRRLSRGARERRRLGGCSEEPAGGEFGADLQPLLLRQPPGEVVLVYVAVGLAEGDREGKDRLLGVGELRTGRRCADGIQHGFDLRSGFGQGGESANAIARRPRSRSAQETTKARSPATAA